MERMDYHFQDGKQHDPMASPMILHLFEDVPTFASIVAHASAYPAITFVQRLENELHRIVNIVHCSSQKGST